MDRAISSRGFLRTLSAKSYGKRSSPEMIPRCERDEGALTWWRDTCGDLVHGNAVRGKNAGVLPEDSAHPSRANVAPTSL